MDKYFFCLISVPRKIAAKFFTLLPRIRPAFRMPSQVPFQECDASSTLQPHRCQHKFAEVACYSLARTLMVVLPTPHHVVGGGGAGRGYPTSVPELTQTAKWMGLRVGGFCHALVGVITPDNCFRRVDQRLAHKASTYTLCSGRQVVRVQVAGDVKPLSFAIKIISVPEQHAAVFVAFPVWPTSL